MGCMPLDTGRLQVNYAPEQRFWRSSMRTPCLARAAFSGVTMAQLKIATFNIEWMISLFGGAWSQWDGTIPSTFPGKSLGGIRLAPIEDVPALCERIAGVIKAVDPKILAVQEGPPRKDQMELFVREHLDDDYVVHSSNARNQALHVLVHRSIANKVTSFAHDGPETTLLRSAIHFYPWGGIAVDERKSHKFDRRPLVLTFQPSAGKRLRIVNVHTKSKFSKLKLLQQWLDRDRDAIIDALLARQKLSAEVCRLREYVVRDLGPGNNPPDACVILGDLNDGAYAELMEREFLIHNIIDELVGSFLEPDTFLRHAMTPTVISESTTVSFPDPVEGGQIVEELIDHIVVSPGIWQAATPFKLKAGSCKVELQAYKDFDDTDEARRRGDRPSDHRPVSAVIEY
jgi:endonuclease/exonuclease/phosphatase family metal-dependent hydrolase